jgi:hypothetical protein
MKNKECMLAWKCRMMIQMRPRMEILFPSTIAALEIPWSFNYKHRQETINIAGDV